MNISSRIKAPLYLKGERGKAEAYPGPRTQLGPSLTYTYIYIYQYKAYITVLEKFCM